MNNLQKRMTEQQFRKQTKERGNFIHTEEKSKRLEIRRTINEAGHEFFERVYNANKDLGNIIGEFMALNEEYVLNHSGEEETNGTVDILQVGFTTNQLMFLERLCDMLLEKGQKQWMKKKQLMK